MMPQKKLSEVQAELVHLLSQLPGPSPSQWFANEIALAKDDPKVDVETLEALCAALERQASPTPPSKPKRRPAKR